MKFLNLLRKELKELFTLQMLISLALTVLLFVGLGTMMSDAVDDAVEASGTITICDQDQTDLTEAIIDLMKTTDTNGNGTPDYEVKTVDITSADYAAELKRLDLSEVVIIPKGFSAQVEANQKADVEYVSALTSSSQMSNLSIGSDTAIAFLSSAVKSALYEQKNMTMEEITLLEAPLNTIETTVVGDNSAKASSSSLISIISTQSMFVPLVVFILVIYSSQMIISAISTEKINKTLETLLSAPVSRLAVLSSKMLAAAIASAVNAVVYMIGFNKMMDGMTGDLLASSNGAYDSVMSQLGLNLSLGDYALLGMQMFLTILISLSVSLILGALAKDTKAAQTMLMPIMILAMLPYMLTMFVDIKTMTPVLKYLVYAIPFTHTFIASENIMFDNMSLYWGGFAYQVVLLIICMTVAVRIFTSDKIFTLTLDFSKKHSAKKKAFAFGKK